MAGRGGDKEDPSALWPGQAVRGVACVYLARAGEHLGEAVSAREERKAATGPHSEVRFGDPGHQSLLMPAPEVGYGEVGEVAVAATPSLCLPRSGHGGRACPTAEL